MEKRKRPPVPDWWHWPRPKVCAHINTAAPANQLQQQRQKVRTDSRQWREGRGRAGQGRVWRLVVVVVAASETVRLSRLRVLTVDSLSTVDLTSQGFFYIPACACVHLCVGACTKKKKKKERSLCVYVCVSRSGDVIRRKHITPLGGPRLFSWPFGDLTEAPLSISCS